MQFLLNAMNANTAAIAQGYAEGVIQTYNADLTNQGLHAKFTQVVAYPMSATGAWRGSPRAYLYNPGLVGVVVCRDRNIRSAADPERLHRGGYFDGEGARSRNHRTIADVAGRDVRNHRRENRAAVSAALPDGAVRDRP